MTEKVYKSNPYLTELDAEILSCEPGDAGEYKVLLDRTIFFPTGGGQNCDKGLMDTFAVTDVKESGDDVIHNISVPDGSAPPAVGQTVHLTLDWENRFDNMQRHSGEHILSGAFFRLFGGVNAGFHMGESYMTIDISMEGAEQKELTAEMIAEAELEANRVIWRDVPITTQLFATAEDASAIPVRKAISVESDISVVVVGDPGSPDDAVACCGTHPSSSGQVGLIKVFRHEPNKGMTRVFFDAGRKAFATTTAVFAQMTDLHREFSSGISDFAEKYSSHKAKEAAVRQRLYNLTKEVVSREAADLGTLLAEGAAVVRDYRLLTSDDVISIGRSLQGSIPSLLFLISHEAESGPTLFLFSDTADCGKLIKDNIGVFGGKGGGSKNFARGIFTREDDLMTFIDAVKMLEKK